MNMMKTATTVTQNPSQSRNTLKDDIDGKSHATGSSMARISLYPEAALNVLC